VRKQANFVLLLLCACAAAYAQQPAQKCAQLPGHVAAMLRKQFPASHVVTRNDLYGDDQALWARAYGDACPGWVSGTFKPGSRQYAITLVEGSADRLRQALVLVDASPAHPQSWVLMPMEHVARASVVRRLPGKKSMPDSVIFEAIEAGALTYSWVGDKFERQVSAK